MLNHRSKFYVYSYILLVNFIVDVTGRELSGGATLITEFRLIQIVRRTEEEKKKNFPPYYW
jgi:hypothetical protein